MLRFLLELHGSRVRVRPLSRFGLSSVTGALLHAARLYSICSHEPLALNPIQDSLGSWQDATTPASTSNKKHIAFARERRLEIESRIFDDLPRIPYDHFTMIARPLT